MMKRPEDRQADEKIEDVLVSLPSAAAIAEIMDKHVDLAMVTAGCRAYDEWYERDDRDEDIGGLVRLVYASMQAQLELEMEHIRQAV